MTVWAGIGVVAAVLAGCTPNRRINPNFCDPDGGGPDCPTGQVCIVKTFTCVSTNAGVDADAAGDVKNGDGGTDSGQNGDGDGQDTAALDNAAPDTAPLDTAADDGPGGDATDALDDASDVARTCTCTSDSPICDTGTGTCGPCVSNDDCKAIFSASKPFCETGKCVACLTKADCPVATPLCSDVSRTCTTCQSNTECATNFPLRPVCSGGTCVGCAADTDCHDVTKPFCSAPQMHTCVPCQMAPVGPTACTMKSMAQPVCAPSGACVQCVVNADCTAASPACSTTNTCGRCAADADCAGKAGPVVCMSHQDGRCASDTETVYVQNKTGCSDATGASGGTSAMPFCSLQPAVAVVGATRDLVVVMGSVTAATAAFQASTRELSIVGQTSGLIAGGLNPALHFSGGNAYVRDLKLTISSIGCQADSGANIRLDHLTVNANPGGGIFLDGSTFVIANTAVTNNGPGDIQGLSWGGMRIQNVPAAGPAQLKNLTVQSNMSGGISCAAAVQASGVLTTMNVGVDVSPTCGFSSCGTMASPTCGAP